MERKTDGTLRVLRHLPRGDFWLRGKTANLIRKNMKSNKRIDSFERK